MKVTEVMYNQKEKFLLISFLVGCLTVFIGMAVTSGGVQNAINMLVILTVCTLGIGLLIWAGMAWLVGMVIVGSIWGIMRVTGLIPEDPAVDGGEITAETRPQQRLSSTELALVNYTKKAKERGLSDTQIASRLQAQGWSNEEIELAQGLANVNTRRRFEAEE